MSSVSQATSESQGSDDEYSKLRRIAQNLVNHESQCTLTATGLVHELVLKLHRHAERRGNAGDEDAFGNPFFASRVMKQILIDRARKRLTRSKSEGIFASEGGACQEKALERDRAAQLVVELDDAIDLLAESMPENAELCRLRIYSGLSVEAASEQLGMSRATAYRKWNFCKTWLASKIDSPR